MINISALHKTFNQGKPNQVNATNGVDLNIDDSEYVIIVGSNGSGKSTLLNLVAGSILPTSGSISINSINVTRLQYWSPII